jgi:hypothetical protein
LRALRRRSVLHRASSDFGDAPIIAGALHQIEGKEFSKPETCQSGFCSRAGSGLPPRYPVVAGAAKLVIVLSSGHAFAPRAIAYA